MAIQITIDDPKVYTKQQVNEQVRLVPDSDIFEASLECYSSGTRCAARCFFIDGRIAIGEHRRFPWHDLRHAVQAKHVDKCVRTDVGICRPLKLYFHGRTKMTQGVVQVVAGILCLILVAVIIMRRKGRKKREEDEF